MLIQQEKSWLRLIISHDSSDCIDCTTYMVAYAFILRFIHHCSCLSD